MKQQAFEKNNHRGLVAAHQCLSNAYIGSQRWEEGATAYIFKIVAKYGEFVSPEAVSEMITTSVVPVIETPVIPKFTTEVSVVLLTEPTYRTLSLTRRLIL